jgi:sulfate transport system ATP-binding protein
VPWRIQPRVLLLDEPFGALDARVRQDLRRWLRRLHDEIHVTSVFVTHDQEEALEVSDQVVVMSRGKIEQVGTPDEVFHHPKTEFVLNFLGNVNLFHGRIEDTGRPVFESGLVAEETIGGTRRFFVRPHELDIHRQAPDDGSALPAKIVTIQSAGPSVKIELTNSAGDSINVDLSHARFEELRIARGEDVFVSPRRVKVFEDFGSGI